MRDDIRLGGLDRFHEIVLQRGIVVSGFFLGIGNRFVELGLGSFELGIIVLDGPVELFRSLRKVVNVGFQPGVRLFQVGQ